jgi:hypothetical protein
MHRGTKPLEELIRELPPRLKSKVQTFVEALLTRSRASTNRTLRQDWAGMLKAENSTLVDLQHRALDWRSRRQSSCSS